MSTFRCEEDGRRAGRWCGREEYADWTFGYDPLNRLCTANQSATLSQCGQSATYTYGYDRYGNRWQQVGQSSMYLTFSGNNNHIDGYSYDAAGNLLSDGVHSYSYDAENRLIAVDGGTTANYIYDAEGRRVQSIVAGVATSFVYDSDGHQVIAVDGSGNWLRGEVYAAGRHIAAYTGGTSSTESSGMNA